MQLLFWAVGLGWSSDLGVAMPPSVSSGWLIGNRSLQVLTADSCNRDLRRGCTTAPRVP